MSSQDAFNYAIGVLACLSALVSVVLYYQTYLPITQMKALDELLNDTRNLYMRAKEDGVLPHGIAFTGNLEELELESDELREQAYKATTQLEEYSALLQGLSRKIMRTAGSVKRFRAYVITASEEQRRQQRGSRRASIAHRRAVATSLNAAALLTATESATTTDDISNTTDFNTPGHQIMRPTSCPPILQFRRPAGYVKNPRDHLTTTVPTLRNKPTDSNFLAIDPALLSDDGSLISCTPTVVEDPPPWWSLPVPFSKLRWCFEILKDRDVTSDAESHSTDIESLPV